MKKIIIIAIIALTVFTSCGAVKEGCPAAHSNGIMRGKFKG